MRRHFVRKATVNDSKGILDIYSYYIENTVASFEIKTPSLSDFSDRVDGLIKDYPYFVSTADGTIVGYTYAAKEREREAYRYNVEVSVYIRQDMQGYGIGTSLYDALFKELEHRDYYNAYAAITLPNEKSVALHHKFGFKDIGVHHKTGYKFDKWLDVLWLEKAIKSH